MMTLARYAFAFGSHYSGLDTLFRFLVGPSLSVLMYHRLRDRYDPYGLSISLATFQKQVAWLRKQGWLVSLEDGLIHLEGTRRIVRYAMTFDDGYADNARLLEMKDTPPASIFLVSSAIGGETLWVYRLGNAIDRSLSPHVDLSHLGLGRFNLTLESEKQRLREQFPEVIKQLPDTEAKQWVTQLVQQLEPDSAKAVGEMLDWPTIHALVSRGICIGGHTHTHPLLSRVDDDCALQEIRGCRDHLAEHLSAPPTQFAYPNGRPHDFSQRDVDLLRSEGFTVAVTTTEHLNRRGVDRFRIGRFNVVEERYRTPWGQPSRALFFSETSGVLGWLLQKARTWRALT